MSIDFIKSRLNGTSRSTFDKIISKVLGDVDDSNYKIIDYINHCNFTIVYMSNKLICNHITQIRDALPKVIW